VFAPYSLERVDGHEAFEVLNVIIELLQCSIAMVKTHWRTLRTYHADVTFHHLEAILCHRAGNDRDTVRKFIKEFLVTKTEPDHLERAKKAGGTEMFALIKVDDSCDYSPPKK
jgi:hypothetical protein